MNMPMPMGATLAPLSWGQAFAAWRFAPITTMLLLVALLAYLGAVVMVRRRGGRWAAARTGCFAGGLAMIAVAIMGSPGIYGDAGLFWVHSCGPAVTWTRMRPRWPPTTRCSRA